MYANPKVDKKKKERERGEKMGQKNRYQYESFKISSVGDYISYK